MSKIGLVIKREYLNRVSKKSFLLLTFLTPFLFAALVFVPLWLSSIKGDDAKQIAILDSTGKYAPLFKNTEEYTFITEQGVSLETYRNNPDKEIYAFLNITGDLLQNPNAATLYSQKQISMGLKDLVDKTLSDYLRDEKLASYHIDNLKQIIDESKINFTIKTVKWDEDGSEKSTSAEVASILGMILTIVIYMFIIMYGSMVMQGVMEEKTNRIIEVMISSVKPYDLMIMDEIRKCGMYCFLHICKDRLDMSRYEGYGKHADAVNWGVYEAPFSLEAGRKLFSGCAVMGGLPNRSGVLADGSDEEIEKTVHSILDSFGTDNFILGADCTLATEQDIHRLVVAIDEARK